jgi:hypothetical protein
MKTIIFAAVLALALTAPVPFSMDSNEASPISLLTKGFFNPEVDGQTKIETFLKLANELIPLAEVEGNMENSNGQKLGYVRGFCLDQSAAKLFNACFNLTAELWIGWAVNQLGVGMNSTDSAAMAYNVTYTPFSFLRGGISVAVESYPAEVSYGAFFSLYDITIPISIQAGQSGLCYSGVFNFAPGSLYTQIGTALLECGWCFTPYCFEGCNKVQGPNFQHLYYALWNGYQQSFLAYTCQNFNF